jgi:hypothetical protein
MTASHEAESANRGWMRIGLLFLAVTTLNGSMWALPFPRSFYDEFPLPGREWVSTLGPYDEHLVRDYGALNLALGILLVGAAIVLERRLTLVALVSWLGYAAPHFLYHTTLTEHFSLVDDAAQLTSLGLQVVLPLALLAVAVRTRHRHGPPAARTSGSHAPSAVGHNVIAADEPPSEREKS